MSGIEAAGLALGMISAIITIIDTTIQVYEAVKDEAGLPTNFKRSATKLPLISKLLEDAEIYVKNMDEATETAFTPTLEDCKAQVIQLQELFMKVMPEEGELRWDRYVKAARSIGKGGRVEDLVRGILDNLQLLATRSPEVTTQRTRDQLAKAVEEVTQMEPSLAEGFEQMPAYAPIPGDGPILVLGLISSIIAILDGTKKVYDEATDSKGLPVAFREVAGRLGLVRTVLEAVKQQIISGQVDEELCKAIIPVVAACKEKAEKLHMLFQKVVLTGDDSSLGRYMKAAKTLGKGARVESCIKGLLEDLQLLVSSRVMAAFTVNHTENIDVAIEDMSNIEPSNPDSVFQETAFLNFNERATTTNINAPRRLKYQPEFSPVRERLRNAISSLEVLPKATYKYHPIDNNRQTRLLRVQAGQIPDKLQCMLFSSPIDPESERKSRTLPSYSMLSHYESRDKLDEGPIAKVHVYYDTGARGSKQTLTPFNRYGTLYVTKSIEFALMRLRRPLEDVTVWVDALCVNNEDNSEWEAQMSLIDTIYSNSERVWAWLGSGTSTTRETFQFLRQILDLRFLDDISQDRIGQMKWLLFFQLLQTPMPKLEIAQRLIVFFGDEEMEGQDFLDAVALGLTKAQKDEEIKAVARSHGFDVEAILRTSINIFMFHDVGLDDNANANFSTDGNVLTHYGSLQTAVDSGYASGPVQPLERLGAGRLFTPVEEMIGSPQEVDELEHADDISDMSADESVGYQSSSGGSYFGDDIRETAQGLILEILEEDKDLHRLFKEALVKFDKPRVQRNIAGFIRGYCHLLDQCHPTADQKQGLAFLRHRRRQVASLLCSRLDPSYIEVQTLDEAEKARNQKEERKFRLGLFLSTDHQLTPNVPIANYNSDEESNFSSRSDSGGLPPVLEDIKNFLVDGEPLALFRLHFARFVAGEPIKEWNAITKMQSWKETHSSKRGVQPGTQDAIVDLHNGKFAMSWHCRCNRVFESVVPAPSRQVAENVFLKLDWSETRDGLAIRTRIQSGWLEDLIWVLAPNFLGRFSWDMEAESSETPDLEGGLDLGIQRIDSLTPNPEDATVGKPAVEASTTDIPAHTDDNADKIYVCVYKKEEEEWRLRHAKIPRSRTSGSNTQSSIGVPPSQVVPTNEKMDEMLFITLRQKLLRTNHILSSTWNFRSLFPSNSMKWPWHWSFSLAAMETSLAWVLRLFNPIAISGLEFWEFKLNPAPKLVDPVEKDKLPDGDDISFLSTDSWEYSEPQATDLLAFKGLISGKYLLHLLKTPNHAKPNSPIWSGLPKKLRSKLTNERDIQIPGWGFQVNYEWDSKAFLVMTIPVILLGFCVATTFCVVFHWPMSAGVTLALAPVTILTYINTMMGGVTKQRGLSK